MFPNRYSVYVDGLGTVYSGWLRSRAVRAYEHHIHGSDRNVWLFCSGIIEQCREEYFDA